MQNELLKISQVAGEVCKKAWDNGNGEIYDVARHVQLVIQNYLEEDGSMVFKGGKQ